MMQYCSYFSGHSSCGVLWYYIIYHYMFQCVNNRPHCVRLYTFTRIRVNYWRPYTWWEIRIKTLWVRVFPTFPIIFRRFISRRLPDMLPFTILIRVIRKTCVNTPFTEDCRNDIIISTRITWPRCSVHTHSFLDIEGLWSTVIFNVI